MDFHQIIAKLIQYFKNWLSAIACPEVIGKRGRDLHYNLHYGIVTKR